MIGRYARWLHTRWPTGAVEKLPEADRDGRSNLPGVFLVGDLVRAPLLKFAMQSGVRAARAAAASLTARSRGEDAGALDVVVLGAGVAGVAAAIEAGRLGLACEVIEATLPFSTLIDMPKGKPIFTYPSAFIPEGGLQVRATVKEDLVAELRAQMKQQGIVPRTGRATGLSRDGDTWKVELEHGESLQARRVIVAIGRSGDSRRLDVPGETLDKVAHRLLDPAEARGQRVLVVGGGDSAVEAAVALADAGAEVTLAHRRTEWTRPKAENLETLKRSAVKVRLGATIQSIESDQVRLVGPERTVETIANDRVFVLIGRDPPLRFLRRAGIRIAGDMSAAAWLGLALSLLFCVGLYNWKSGGRFTALWYGRHWFPTNLLDLMTAAGGVLARAAHDPRTVWGTLAISASSPAFWYTLAYSLVIVIFGIRRIRRRRTPYVMAQTAVLMAIQVFPLFLIPELILPWLHHRQLLPVGIENALFPMTSGGHGREFWRAYGLILAWPLNVYNIFTHEPLWWWIGIGFVQTFVVIPLAVYFYGKGAYCGWICSCGALAETLGDGFRQRMPHGLVWNRLNLAGQLVLAIVFALLAIRVVGWILPPGNWADAGFDRWKEHYKWGVDVFLAGVLGYGLYFWFSGRVWCRFFCPLAALMHIYARLGRFAIVPEKARCISCNACTSSCHQGIDVMSFASRGQPMIDPQCVRCSACVEVCPTGTLQFGQVRRDGTLIQVDTLAASPVLMREKS